MLVEQQSGIEPCLNVNIVQKCDYYYVSVNSLGKYVRDVMYYDNKYSEVIVYLWDTVQCV